jgi:hypothetical protein
MIALLELSPLVTQAAIDRNFPWNVFWSLLVPTRITWDQKMCEPVFGHHEKGETLGLAHFGCHDLCYNQMAKEPCNFWVTSWALIIINCQPPEALWLNTQDWQVNVLPKE